MIRRGLIVLGVLLAVEAGCTVVPTPADQPTPRPSPNAAPSP